MSMVSHLEELRKKHRILDTQIEAVERSPGTDRLEVKSLKQRKLRLKDEINRLAS